MWSCALKTRLEGSAFFAGGVLNIKYAAKILMIENPSFRMTDSKSGSKDNLNESNMPLLESEEKAEETPEKEVVEMELEEKEEKKDEVTEKDKKEEKKKKEKKTICRSVPDGSDKKYWFIWFCNNLMWIEKKASQAISKNIACWH